MTMRTVNLAGLSAKVASGMAAMALCGVLATGCSSPSGSPAGTTSSPAGASSSTATTGASSTTATTGAASGSWPKTCPPASVVNAALGGNAKSPTLTQQPYGISCSYAGSGPIATRVDFQEDTSATFAAGEAAVPSVVKVSGLGDAAYGVSGFLAVLNGSYAIRISAPLSSLAQLETLARKLL